MYHFGPNENYTLGIDVLAFSQALLLAYLWALGSKDKIKKCVDRAVLAYFIYTIAAVLVTRSHYLVAEDRYYEHFGQLPPYLGIDYQTLNATMSSLIIVFLLTSLNLWYALLKRKIDLPMIFSYAICSTCIVLVLINKETMITSRENSKIFQAIVVPIYLYGFGIMWNGLRKLPEGLEKKRLRLFFWAYMVPFIGIFFLLYLSGEGFVNQSQFNMTLILLGAVRTAAFVWGIVIYGIFRMDLTYASEDIFENMDDPVLLLSPKNEIMRANPSALQVLRLASEDLQIEGSSRPSILDVLPNFSNSKANFEAPIETELGLREYDCANTKVFRRDEHIGNVLLFRDVTREKELARMKTDFTSTVSHELRTPLTSVLGFARIIQKRFNEVIRNKYQPENKKEQRAIKQISSNLNVIISESKRLTSLINDVLDISKMEAGRIDWRFARCNPKTIVAQALQATDGLFTNKPIERTTDIPQTLPEIVADSDRIIQVIINLISNAVKFTEEGSVTIRAELEKGNLLIHVSDTGSGISKADQMIVFDKYKQVADVLTDKPQGTGLGLPISKQIIEQHGGKIWLESTINEGSTFSFSLPLADLPQTLHHPISFSDLLAQIALLKYTPNEEKKKILLIDDEDSIRQILRQSFEAIGHHVIEAKDGKQGLSKAYESNPDLIVLDVMMPKMNGFDVASTLKNDPKYMGIPIIMLTVVDDAQRIYGLGVERYITKPFEPDHIVSEGEVLMQNRGKPRKALLLGNLGSNIEPLQRHLLASGFTLKVAVDLTSLSRLITEQNPDLLIVYGEQYSNPENQPILQEAIGTTSILTRTIKTQ